MRLLSPFLRSRSTHQRVRGLIALAAICVVAISAAGCLASRSNRVRVPAAETLYVVAFVDMTREGKVGVPLAEAIQIEVFRRDPSRLSVVFDDKSVALDGTVVAVEDTAREAGMRSIRIQVEMMLTNKAGETVADLGRVSVATAYEVHADMAETERHRDEAIAAGIAKTAVHVVDAVDRAGAGEPPVVAKRSVRRSFARGGAR